MITLDFVVSDNLWRIVKDYIPQRKPKATTVGRKVEIENRYALECMLYIIRTGTTWAEFRTPDATGISIYRRKCEWDKGRFWDETYPIFMELLPDFKSYDWKRLTEKRNMGATVPRKKRQYICTECAPAVGITVFPTDTEFIHDLCCVCREQKIVADITGEVEFPTPVYERDHINLEHILPGEVYLVGVCTVCGEYFTASTVKTLKNKHVNCRNRVRMQRYRDRKKAKESDFEKVDNLVNGFADGVRNGTGTGNNDEDIR